jgi:carbon-monoxide dehydrogenase small subunit
MSPKHDIEFTLNGVKRRATVDITMNALDMLREVIGLTGTKYGCGEGECGACTIQVDGVSLNSCLMFAVDCDGRSVTTIEGLANDGRGDALRDAFVEHGAVQCGFCTPGMMMTGRWLLDNNPKPSEAEIRECISGQLCRCTGYKNIVESIQWAAEHPAGEEVSA